MWATAGGDGRNRRVAANGGPPRGAAQIWARTLDVASEGYSAPVALVGGDGTVFASIAETPQRVFALDGSTGAQAWAVTLGGEYAVLALSGDSGTLFVGDENGTVTALDSATGARTWVCAGLGAGPSVRPALVVASDGSVIIGAGASGLASIGGTSGTQQWWADATLGWPFSLGSAVALAATPNGTIVATMSNRATVVLNASSGQVLWVNDQFGDNAPVIGDDGTVYVNGMFLGALRASDGALIWAWAPASR